MSNVVRSTKFVPFAKHAFDISAIRKTQKAVNALLKSRITQGTGAGFIFNSDDNTVIELPAPPFQPPIFPFKVYNINNLTLTATQAAEFSAQAVNPNDYCFQIRNGFISCRPYLGVNIGFLESTSGTTIQGNFELTQAVGTDNSDPTFTSGYLEYFLFQESANSGTGLILPSDGTPGLIYGIPYGSTAGTQPVSFSQVFANPIADDNGNSYAGFWVEIVDDPLNGFYLNLWGQMWTDNLFDSTGRGNNPFPTGHNIIPIGQIGRVTEDSSTFSDNCQFGHLTNRFSQSGNYRGQWNELFAAVPASASTGGLIFYPGDFVIDDKVAGNFGGTGYYGVFIYTGASYNALQSTANPLTYGANWQNIGMIPT